MEIAPNTERRPAVVSFNILKIEAHYLNGSGEIPAIFHVPPAPRVEQALARPEMLWRSARGKAPSWNLRP